MGFPQPLSGGLVFDEGSVEIEYHFAPRVDDLADSQQWFIDVTQLGSNFACYAFPCDPT